VRNEVGEADVDVAPAPAVADPDLALGDVVRATLGDVPLGPIHVDGRAMPATTPLAAAGLRRGSVVAIDGDGATTAARPNEPAAVEVVTVAGAGAGRRRRLDPGRYHAGPGPGPHEFADGRVGHVRWRLVVPTAAEVTHAQLVDLDDRVVELRPVGADDPAALARRRAVAGPVGMDGTVAFNRPPRPAPPEPVPPIAVPDRTRARDDRRSFPVLAMIAPLPISIAMAVMLGHWRFALFGLLSPIIMLANWIEDGRSRRRDAVRASAADATARCEVRADVRARRDADVSAARTAHPHLPDLLEWMVGAHPRLWERRPAHDDAYLVPIGWGDEPWTVPLAAGSSSIDTTRALSGLTTLPGVPITVDLRQGTGVALVGAPDDTRAVARGLVLAAAALHGPADLSVVVCVETAAAAEWEWTKWLPHCRRGDQIRIVTDPGALVGFAAERSHDAPARERREATPDHVTLVVADGPAWWQGRESPLRPLLSAPGATRLLALTADLHLAPATCTTVVPVPRVGRGAVEHLASATTTSGVALNRVDRELALDVARQLGRLDDPERADGGAAVSGPGADLLSALELGEPTVAAIRRRWADPARGPRTAIGVGTGGLVTVDLVDDGPHGLVAGTTGAGKSELLRTLVAGLAATLSPAELNVVLVDFKGGAAFDACARLPHTVGLVTDLDEHLAGRMLRSLRAELASRERVLRAAGVSSLDELATQSGPGRLPRLLLVIDEFALLVAQLPEFVPGLIDIAQRGRSLGFHLLLATQRPAGVIDNKIRANTNLRIALRVHDDADSLDVIGTRQAATIPRQQPGQAVARFGAGELTEFQTALATGTHDPIDDPVVHVRPAVAARPPTPIERRLLAAVPVARRVGAGASDLERLVDAIVGAAADVEAPRRPCQDPLPTLLTAHDLHHVGGYDGEQPAIPLALVDLPDEQRQTVRMWHPGPDGSLAFIGMPGSGTSSALVALALGLAATTAPDDAHVYVIDADAGRMGPLAKLPHVGAVVGVDDTARLARLVRHLDREIDRRRGRAAESRSPAAVVAAEPAVVVLVDNVASLRHTLDGDRDLAEVWPTFERIVRDGAGVGLTTVLTATHERALPPALTANLAQRLVLRLADRAAYASFGFRAADVPEMGPGRALCPRERSELQLVAPPADLGGAIDAVVDRWPSARRPPRPVAPLPARLPAADVVLTARETPDGWVLPVGVDTRDGEIVALTLRRGGSLAVLGPPGSGRTSLLRTMAAGLAAADPDVPRFAIGPRPGGLDGLAIAPSSPADVPAWLDQILAPGGQRVVFVDDADRLDGPSFVRLAEAAGAAPVAVVVAGAPDALRAAGHWARPLVRTRSGVLLAPGPGDGDLLRINLPLRTTVPTPGRGLVVVDGRTVPVLFADGGEP